MKNWAIILPFAGILALTAGCDALLENIPTGETVTVSIKSDIAFSLVGDANLTLTLSSVSTGDVSVNLAVARTAQDGYIAVDAEYLSFDGSVSIPAGKTEATVKVTAELENLSTANQAVITIAAADGAEIDPDASVAYIYVPDTGDPSNEGPGPEVHELDWKVEYKGHQWVEGLETEGQLDVFEVSGTPPGKYYIPYYSSLGSYYEDDEYTPESYGESLAKDPETFLADMQANIDAMIANYLEYGYSLQDYFDDYVYNEAVDGTTILYYGQYAGDYEFLVLSMDATGKLDYGYKLITFTIDSDPETQYDWDIVANIREDWTAQPAEWVSGYEGQYFWVDGYAPGAAYTIIDLYTDAEIDWYLGGELKNFIGNQNSYIQTYLNEGYTPGEIFEYLGAAVDEDGYFYDYLSTYNIEGEAYVLILGFDENGQLINTSAYSNGADMGKALIDVPVYTPEPLDLSLNENWGAEFLGTFTDHQVNTYYNSETGEDEEVEEDVDLSVIKLTGLLDGEYVGTGLYEAGYLDELDETDFSDYVRYAGEGVIYTLDYYNTYYPEYGYTLADVANTAKDPWLYYSGVTEEYYGEWDVLIAGVSEDLEVTGEYALATITFDGTRLDSDPTLVVKKVVRGKADLKKAASAKRHVVKTAPAERAARAFTKRAPGKKAAARKPASLKSTSAKLAR